MKGKICDWKDDKGYGFIVSENQLDRIFFHISDVETKEKRPRIGDFVDFNLTRDNERRLKAKNINIKGLSSKKGGLVNQSNVEPVKRTVPDYIAIIVFLMSIGTGCLIFFQTKDLKNLIPYGVVAIITIIFFSRQKMPKEKNFTCARCKTVAVFDQRTIQAWNKGLSKFYCHTCHQQWLITQQPEIRGSKSGCLGVLIVLTLLPVLIFLSLYSWLS